MLPPRIERRQTFINAIASNDDAQIMVGVWGIGPNFHCADPAFGEYSSVTPLMAAIERGNTKLVQRLLTHVRDPADPNAICEGVALFTTGEFGDFLYISPLVRCIQRHHLASPSNKQTFEQIYNLLRARDADLYAVPPTQGDTGKTPTQEIWERNIEIQMTHELTALHAHLEEQYQQHTSNQNLKSKLQNAVNAAETPTSTRKQKI